MKINNRNNFGFVLLFYQFPGEVLHTYVQIIIHQLSQTVISEYVPFYLLRVM